MITAQYKATYISSSTISTIAATGTNATLHTVNIPKALTGTATFKDGAASTTYFVLPIGSIGSQRFDSSCPNGLTVKLSVDETIIVTTKTP